jgi:hypothetical protein
MTDKSTNEIYPKATKTHRKRQKRSSNANVQYKLNSAFTDYIHTRKTKSVILNSHGDDYEGLTSDMWRVVVCYMLTNVSEEPPPSVKDGDSTAIYNYLSGFRRTVLPTSSLEDGDYSETLVTI